MKIKRLPKEVNKGIEFGSLIRKMRLECGLSQLELAEKLNFDTGTTISFYESNKRKVSAYTLYRITLICGYTFKIKEEDEEDPHTCPCNDDNCPKEGEYDMETDHIEDCPCKECHVKLG